MHILLVVTIQKDYYIRLWFFINITITLKAYLFHVVTIYNIVLQYLSH